MEDKIIELLKKDHYLIQDIIPKELSWTPDLYAKKDNKYYAFEIREKNTIPETSIQRMSQSKLKRDELYIYVIFKEKPLSSIIKYTEIYGIGIKYISKSNIVELLKSRCFSSLKEIIQKDKKRIHKMKKIDIFISSHQDILERRKTIDRINFINKSHKCPIYPVLVEDDPSSNISKIKKIINKNMDNSDYFLGILEKQYRELVDYEFKRCFKCFGLKK